ncbi:hypothetical protein ANO14919_061160 [Xylariales sp. No.14919]|nr:hypothetical protein ANO14919_061160 [Xylariales sp. No.14919]
MEIKREPPEEVPETSASGDASAVADGAPPAATLPAVPATGPAPSPTPTSAASVEPSSTDSAAQRPYIPQFSAATQMILSRINSKPGSLSAALSSASSMARSIEKSAFEDAKRRLVMNMNTSLTMPMPTPKKVPPPPPSSTDSSLQLKTPAPAPTTGAAKPLLTKPTASKLLPPKQKGKAARGTKRKRGKENLEVSSSLTDLSDTDTDAAKAQKAATMTKSGRQVQKPAQFNPVDSAGSQKRKSYGKRTAEQALCK